MTAQQAMEAKIKQIGADAKKPLKVEYNEREKRRLKGALNDEAMHSVPTK